METTYERIVRKLDHMIEQTDELADSFRGTKGIFAEIRETNRKTRRDAVIGGFILAGVIVWGFIHVASAMIH